MRSVLGYEGFGLYYLSSLAVMLLIIPVVK